MNSDKAASEQYEPLLQMEMSARDMYGSFLKRVNDPFLSVKLREIYEDEQRHVEIAQALMKGDA